MLTGRCRKRLSINIDVVIFQITKEILAQLPIVVDALARCKFKRHSFPFCLCSLLRAPLIVNNHAITDMGRQDRHLLLLRFCGKSAHRTFFIEFQNIPVIFDWETVRIRRHNKGLRIEDRRIRILKSSLTWNYCFLRSSHSDAVDFYHF